MERVEFKTTQIINLKGAQLQAVVHCVHLLEGDAGMLEIDSIEVEGVDVMEEMADTDKDAVAVKILFMMAAMHDHASTPHTGTVH
jgi:hypothetical protein